MYSPREYNFALIHGIHSHILGSQVGQELEVFWLHCGWHVATKIVNVYQKGMERSTGYTNELGDIILIKLLTESVNGWRAAAILRLSKYMFPLKKR